MTMINIQFSRFRRSLLIIFLIVIAENLSFSNVVLPAVFNNGMVLQQNTEVAIWGWAKPGETVSISGTWTGQVYVVTVPNTAFWKTTISTPKGSFDKHSMVVKGYNQQTINNILFGEVWLCSGQSNMEWTARNKINNAEQEVKEANYPQIRFFAVAHKTAPSPQLDLTGSWKVCSPETMIDFSSTAYFFGRELFKNLKVPIGLINSSWGGTPAEVWCSESTISNSAILKKAAETLIEVPWGPTKPGVVFNAMISPLVPFKFAGAIWYQGEGNTGFPFTYDLLLKAMIQNWRQVWQYDFPFYFVQIAPFEYNVPLQGAILRDAQRKALDLSKTGMVVVSDIGNTKDIHPLNKQDVGKRLGNLALNQTYGLTELPISGPLFKSFTIEKTKIRLSFDFVYEQLVCKDKELTLFEIAGEDKKFFPAQAKIDKNTILVSSKMVTKPIAVRFAFSNTAEPNLFNSKGLPASCFRTDNWDITLN